MIISIEGIDASGKNTIAKKIATHFNLKYVDTDWNAHPPQLTGDAWVNAIQGINLQQCQMYRSLDNFVKTRFSLSEYAYSKYFNRLSLFDQYKMEECGLEKNYLIYIDLEYSKYKEISERYRPFDDLFTEEEFNKQRDLFLEAFNRSIILNKVIIKNEGSLDELEKNCILWIEKSMNSKLSNINRTIVSCSLCPNMLKSCKEVNTNYARPIIPNLCSIELPKYVFIGISPGRGANNPFSIKAFSHSSGSILHNILKEFNILDKCYFTNLIKCNTPKDKKFSKDVIINCKSHLESEVDILETIRSNSKLKEKITYFVLGGESKEYIKKYYDGVFTEENLIFINHPSFLNYNRSQEALQAYKESIKKHI